ncbi:hypothetical protein ACEV60_17910 [Enterobacter ludwigii]|uniref:hypothetical protein n=1 Tax=Enterobacter ludwigii TaxID=299767 RepID=UPI001BD23D07|nr:hypothetical protein [Enterobacter hormaechei]
MLYPRSGWAALLILAGMLFSLPGYALCLSGDQTVSITTPYHFASGPVRVDVDLPLGTVIATTLIPEGSVITRCDSVSLDGVWSKQGLHSRYQMASTNMDGVGLRVVSEKLGRTSDGDGEPAWRWNVRKPLRHITQGGLRIELIKTGPIRPGVLTTVASDVQYRLYTGSPPHQRLAVVESLRYVGQLVIDVIGTGAVQGDQRLS